MRGNSATPQLRKKGFSDYNTPHKSVPFDSDSKPATGTHERRKSRFQTHLKRVSSDQNILGDFLPDKDSQEQDSNPHISSPIQF